MTYECHLSWHLNSHYSKRKRVWVSEPKQDVTFMAVTDEDLKALR